MIFPKPLFLVFSLFFAAIVNAQTTKTFIFHKDGKIIHTVPTSEVDSIVFVHNEKDKPDDPTPGPSPIDSIKPANKCIDDNHPHAIDLGLPSGLLWSCCNVSAESPTDYGGYYAWSETETKATYEWENYSYCITKETFSGEDWIYPDHFFFTKYVTNEDYGKIDNKTILDLEDDAAYVNMGNNWRMPTADEMQEIIDRCTWTWTTQDEVNGYKVVGPNGNSIFLPASGSYNFGSSLSNKYTEGFYYTSSLYEQHCKGALYLYFSEGSDPQVTIFDSYFDRRDGRTVRGVCHK
ncbi:MAG: hypothetical protein J5678_01445 [Bacteroidaceae bacterium]|nr:hypothetical protein [Bacteroidaceae bacterium]MBR4782938.1 hypothetical protein [Bacteroidaceae bacterium]